MIIAIVNQKGGTGKTTSAASIAHALAIAGRRVLAIDLDPQGNLSHALGCGYGPGAADMLRNGQIGRVVSARPGLDLVIGGPMTAPVADSLNSRMLGRLTVLQRALAGHGYDWVLIDCPPSLGVLSLNALVAAQGMVVPVSVEHLALQGLVQLSQTMAAMYAEGYRCGCWWIVPTFYDRRERTRRHMLNQLMAHPELGKLVVSPIPRDVKLAECPRRHRTIWEHAPRSRAAQAYTCLVRQIARDVITRDSGNGRE